MYCFKKYLSLWIICGKAYTPGRENFSLDSSKIFFLSLSQWRERRLGFILVTTMFVSSKLLGGFSFTLPSDYLFICYCRCKMVQYIFVLFGLLICSCHFFSSAGLHTRNFLRISQLPEFPSEIIAFPNPFIENYLFSNVSLGSLTIMKELCTRNIPMLSPHFYLYMYVCN